MKPEYETLDQIASLVARWADCTLPCVEWTHRAHLTVGLWLSRELPPREALDRVRAGIRRYNTTCGVENSTTRGYHETLTRFYMAMIAAYLGRCLDRDDWVAVTNGLIEHLGDRDLPLRYYTRERLMSAEARSGWVPPDLQPLD
jgi:hypothetical protein